MKHYFTKSFKKLIPLFVLSTLLCFCLCGCSSDPKNFSVSNMTITLTKAFSEGKADGFDVYLKSDDVIFNAVEETSSDLEYAGYEINSLDDYADELLELNGAKKADLQIRNNYKYFVTSATISGAKYTYVHCIFKNGDSYWVCEFTCKSKNYDKLKKKILNWADSITFS